MEEKVRAESIFLLLWQTFWASLIFLSLFVPFKKKKLSLKFRGEKEEAFHSPENFCRIPVWIQFPYYLPAANVHFQDYSPYLALGCARAIDSSFLPVGTERFHIKEILWNTLKKGSHLCSEKKWKFFFILGKGFILFCTLTEFFCFSFTLCTLGADTAWE